MIVMDASAALAMVSGSPEGVGLRESMLAGEHVVAPELFSYELLNAIRKYVQGGYISKEAGRLWWEAGVGLVDELFPLSDMGAEVLAEALATGHPAYDISYMVLARRAGATLFTLDKRLAEVCAKRDVNCVEMAEI